MTRSDVAGRRQALALAGVIAALDLGLATSAQASVHLWEITEVYSNADGTIQYVELSTSSDFQEQTGGVTFRSQSNGVTFNTFVIPGNLPSTSTSGKTFLLATPGFQAVSGIAPDYTLPCAPFFDPDATSITVELVGADSLSFTPSDLPAATGNALYATTGGVLSTGAATPKNFAGSSGMMTAACLGTGTCDPCADANFCDDACLVGACSGGFTRCPGQLCDEAGDKCADCLGAGDCDDSNPCTDDACVSDACQNTNNTDACDDGLFCNGTDACAGGACVSSGDPCAPDNCLEGSDACGDCTNVADCADDNECTKDTCTSDNCAQTPVADGTACDDDGLFCTGAETCSAGTCTSEGDPCAAAGEGLCDEGTHACDDEGAGGDGGAADDDGGAEVGVGPDGAVGPGTGLPGFGADTEGGVGDGGAPLRDDGGVTKDGGASGCGCRAGVGSDDYSRGATGALSVLAALAALLVLARRRRGSAR